MIIIIIHHQLPARKMVCVGQEKPANSFGEYLLELMSHRLIKAKRKSEYQVVGTGAAVIEPLW